MLTIRQVDPTPWLAKSGLGRPTLFEQEHVDAALERLGLQRSALVFRDMVLTGREQAFLPLGTAVPRDVVRKLCTRDVDEYKRWIGSRDPDGPALTPGLPAGASLVDVARRFIFGDSREVRKAKRAIEERFAPFEAMLVTLGRIELTGGARLVITGFPTILVAEEMILEAGSGVTVFVNSYLTIDRLIKMEAEEGRPWNC